MTRSRPSVLAGIYKSLLTVQDFQPIAHLVSTTWHGSVMHLHVPVAALTDLPPGFLRDALEAKLDAGETSLTIRFAL